MLQTYRSRVKSERVSINESNRDLDVCDLPLLRIFTIKMMLVAKGIPLGQALVERMPDFLIHNTKARFRCIHERAPATRANLLLLLLLLLLLK